MTAEPTARDRYLAPGGLTRRVLNPAMTFLAKRGIGIRGARVLAVRGRRSGEWREVPVNPIEVDGRTYLVAPRGTTDWVRNLRAAGQGRLRLGRRVETVVATELADGEKPAVLRPYLRTWKHEVGVFFDGVDAEASDAELVAAGPSHPVFRVEVTG